MSKTAAQGAAVSRAKQNVGAAAQGAAARRPRNGGEAAQGAAVRRTGRNTKHTLTNSPNQKGPSNSLGPLQSGAEQRREVADGLRTPQVDEFALAPYPIDSFVIIHDTQKDPSQEDWYLAQVLETDPEGGGTLLVWVHGTYQQSKPIHKRRFFPAWVDEEDREVFQTRERAAHVRYTLAVPAGKVVHGGFRLEKRKIPMSVADNISSYNSERERRAGRPRAFGRWSCFERWRVVRALR